MDTRRARELKISNGGVAPLHAGIGSWSSQTAPFQALTHISRITLRTHGTQNFQCDLFDFFVKKEPTQRFFDFSLLVPYAYSALNLTAPIISISCNQPLQHRSLHLQRRSPTLRLPGFRLIPIFLRFVR